MPHQTQRTRFLIMTSIRSVTLLLVLFWSGCAHVSPEKSSGRPFQFSVDRLGFSNETVWSYADGEIKSERDHHQTTGEHYTRRCFVVSRAAVQFWKFARSCTHGISYTLLLSDSASCQSSTSLPHLMVEDGLSHCRGEQVTS